MVDGQNKGNFSSQIDKTLKEDFELRNEFFSNRSSAIFPIYFQDFENDLILSWLNYWTIKNKISRSCLTINIRIYRNSGNLFHQVQLSVSETHNQFRLRSVISEKKFYGMVEFELISTENIRFTFPAITGFYKTRSLYSCVHSAGRIKGADELASTSSVTETNWTCKFSQTTSPFFHYFNGNSTENSEIIVNVHCSAGEVIATKTITRKFAAFASEVYFLDELFDEPFSDEGAFCSVECENGAVFRRMVVGNYHKDLNHMEVTHSFSKQTALDFCPSVVQGYESFLALYTSPSLTLSARVFPTNCPGAYLIHESHQHYDDDRMTGIQESEELRDGHGCIELDNDIVMKVLWFKGKKVPSRFNCSFNYKVKGVQSRFTTDIASGAKSNVYPNKFNHWGSGLYGGGYDFCLLVRNLSHDGKCGVTAGSLMLYGLNINQDAPIKIGENSVTEFILSDWLRQVSNVEFDNPVIFSWYLQLDQPNSETFWLSSRKADGCIAGEHGF